MSGFSELKKIVSNPDLFNKIHEAKEIYTGIFSSIANDLNQADWKNFHRPYKGIKISKGNELQHCPYQVLDIIRDFDLETGLNIRVLNWWGRGVHIFVLFGEKNILASDERRINAFIHSEGYSISAVQSLWDYPKIIDEGQNFKPNDPSYSFKDHLYKLKHIQILKNLTYNDPDTLTLKIKKELKAIREKLLD